MLNLLNVERWHRFEEPSTRTFSKELAVSDCEEGVIGGGIVDLGNLSSIFNRFTG